MQKHMRRPWLVFRNRCDDGVDIDTEAETTTKRDREQVEEDRAEV